MEKGKHSNGVRGIDSCNSWCSFYFFAFYNVSFRNGNGIMGTTYLVGHNRKG